MAEAKIVSHSKDDDLDNISDKYISLEENAADNERVNEGEKSGAKVKHKLTDQGVEYAVPEKAKADDEYSQLESVRYVSFDDKGNAISGDDYSQLESVKYINFDDKGNAISGDIQRSLIYIFAY